MGVQRGTRGGTRVRQIPHGQYGSAIKSLSKKDALSEEPSASSARNATPLGPHATPPGNTMPGWVRLFMRISGIFAIAIFLIPPIYGFKYTVFDSPRENRITQSFEALEADPSAGPDHKLSRLMILKSRLQIAEADQVPLLAHVIDADADSGLRKQAVLTLSAILLRPGATFRRPFESLQGKAVLASAASRDSDPEVKADAENAIDAIAAGGAVIRR